MFFLRATFDFVDDFYQLAFFIKDECLTQNSLVSFTVEFLFSPSAKSLDDCIIGKTNRDEIQNQMRIKFARKLQKRNVTEKSHTSYSQKWLSNVN